jgi:putative ABC transport system permease protein
MHTLLQDVRYALRMLRKSPGFTAIVVVILALGIGVSTTMFSILNGVLFKPLPYPHPEQLVYMFESYPQGYGSFSPANYLDFRAQNKSLSDMAASFGLGTIGLGQGDSSTRVEAMQLSSNMFSVLGTPPLMGRTFTAEEDQLGKPNVVVLNATLWKTELGSDSHIVGKSIILNGEPYTVIGVMPSSFRYAQGVMLPLRFTQRQLQARGSHWLRVIGRLKPGIRLASAQADFELIARGIAVDHPQEESGRSVWMVPLPAAYTSAIRPALIALMLAVSLLLLIACANVANLQLARSMSRSGEFAVRLALGASRFRLVRLLLTESVLLSISGGLLGLFLAYVGLPLLLATHYLRLPRTADVTINSTVCAVAFSLSVLSGILFGIAPALRFSRNNAGEFIKGASPTIGSERTGKLLKNSLAVAQVVIALVLVASSALVLKLLWQFANKDNGFSPEHVLTMKIEPLEIKYKGKHTIRQLWNDVIQNASSQPDVDSAGLISFLPLESIGVNGNFYVVGHPVLNPNYGPIAEFRVVSGNYYQAMRIALLRGRTFNDHDTVDSAPVVIVNQQLVDKYMAGEDPIGKQLDLSGFRATIIGVVHGARQNDITSNILPEVNYPLNQFQPRNEDGLIDQLYLVVRSRHDAPDLLQRVRSGLHQLDPDLQVFRPLTMEQFVSATFSAQKLNALMFGIFAGIALLLASAGLYGVLSYAVSQRTREIGIRMALGAQRGNVLGIVFSEAGKLVFAGIILGVLASVLSARILRSILFGMSPHDPGILIFVSVVLILAAGLAAWFPAQRAISIDPIKALRYE